jgi:hypothetical protein
VFWFLIAAIVGLLTYFAFRPLGTAQLSALAAIIVIVAAIAAYVFRHWLLHAEIGQVERLRLLLGFLTGLAGGYLFVNVGITLSANSVLWTALGVFVFALVAPHFDQWARHLSSFKASGVEIQLATISNRVKAVQPDSREQFLDEHILNALENFEEIIKRDIAYVEHFRIPNLKEAAKQNPSGSIKDEIPLVKDQLDKLKYLQTVFNQIVSPLTRCVKNAIENGYHIESARSELRPVADQLTRIITLEDRKSGPNESPDDITKILNVARSTFWRDLQALSDTFALYADHERANACLAVKTATIPDPTRQNCSAMTCRVLRGHHYFSDLPHLFVSRAFLLLFVGNDELALRELQKAQHDWKMDDIYSGYLMGRVSYYQGRPIEQYVDTLENMKTVAKDRQEVIRTVTAACGTKCSADVQQWGPMLTEKFRRNEYIALNFIAYGIAQDLAQELKQAEARRSIAEDYASQLKKYVESATDAAERDSMLDTAAFVTIASQAGREERDQKAIKDAVDTLATLVARAEQRAAKETNKEVRLTLKEMRAHFASGKSLLEN